MSSPITRLFSSTMPSTRALSPSIVWLIDNPFKGLLLSQMLLSIQLPWTMYLQVHLTSSPAVMGKHANPLGTKAMLWLATVIVAGLNIMLLATYFK